MREKNLIPIMMDPHDQFCGNIRSNQSPRTLAIQRSRSDPGSWEDPRSRARGDGLYALPAG